MAESRATIMERFRKKVAAGLPIIGGGAGTGISAKCEEAGGIDLIVIYNSGRFRMAGRGSLAGLMPYGNANAIVKEMAHEVLTAVSHTPVLAGVCATDPFMIRDRFLRELKDMGFAGIQNFPTVGLIDGVLRVNLEETGMGFAHEIDCIAAAHELDLLTTPYAFDPDQARLLAEAGADIVVAHMGLTTKGSIGAKTAKTLDDCVREVTAIAEAGKAVRDDVLVLCHGGPIALPGRRPVHPRPRAGRRRLLRRQLDGATPHRAGHRPASPRLHGTEARSATLKTRAQTRSHRSDGPGTRSPLTPEQRIGLAVRETIEPTVSRFRPLVSVISGGAALSRPCRPSNCARSRPARDSWDTRRAWGCRCWPRPGRFAGCPPRDARS